MTQYKLSFNPPRPSSDKDSPIIKVDFGDVHLGDLMKDVDGYYYFWPVPRKFPGAWSAHILETVANKLYDLNRLWDRQVVRELKKIKKRLPISPSQALEINATTKNTHPSEPIQDHTGVGQAQGATEINH